jgi:SRSO17 transposase
MPTVDLIPSDVEGLLEELGECQAACHDCFARSEPRAHCFDYIVGQLSPLERQSLAPMALHVEGGTMRGLQRFRRDVAWEEEQRRWTSQPRVADALGEPEGVLMCAETGLVNKGQESVGGARQSWGRLGKVEHGHVGVCAG